MDSSYDGFVILDVDELEEDDFDLVEAFSPLSLWVDDSRQKPVVNSSKMMLKERKKNVCKVFKKIFFLTFFFFSNSFSFSLFHLAGVLRVRAGLQELFCVWLLLLFSPFWSSGKTQP